MNEILYFNQYNYTVEVPGSTNSFILTADKIINGHQYHFAVNSVNPNDPGSDTGSSYEFGKVIVTVGG